MMGAKKSLPPKGAAMKILLPLASLLLFAAFPALAAEPLVVDPAGHDYLREMCSGARYAVIEDVEDLPLELPRIYRTVTRM